ncbi:MAG: ferrous iron transporter B, partial [Gammaproteobacteria bacterium]|nr:ferrous iron transporter B [Gammaproteobacteria bacterium]
EASVVDVPSMRSLEHLPEDEQVALKYLLWGDDRPPVSAHEGHEPPAPLAPPGVIIQVVDATNLEAHLELTIELARLGRPMVIALNMMDAALDRALYINIGMLSRLLGLRVVPVVALMGQGVSQLFAAAADAARDPAAPPPQPISPHILAALRPLSQALDRRELQDAFRVPHDLLLAQVAAGDGYFLGELRQHFPELLPRLEELRREAALKLPRPLEEELHADRHHRAATLCEAATKMGAAAEAGGWRYWLDELFLHPHWGLVGSLMVFAAVLFVVLDISAWIDSVTSARLVELAAGWHPQSTVGVVGRAVVDGLIGLAGIVIPYMIPLVLLLVALEQAGVMQRIAFVVDRGFHRLGLHGGAAFVFLLGLGCNVPAIVSAAKLAPGRERVIASVLTTLVPCSARSAIILALGGKYLGGAGVFAIFALAIVVIAVTGRLLARRPNALGPGQIPDIPPYALPRPRELMVEGWSRTKDILTIVTPLLVGGSIVLALLNHVGADAVINTVFTPITAWWLGLPAVLGVPILFGILRKELSLLMIYQALGTFDVGSLLDWVQIMTFLIFLTFYIPCISTFAAMLKTIGRRNALWSAGLSVGIALALSGVARLLMEGVRATVA